jgi:hypothetical protein
MTGPGVGYLRVTLPPTRWEQDEEKPVLFLLWVLAVILVIAGIVQLFKGQLLWGIVLIIVGFAVGPGGYSIFK